MLEHFLLLLLLNAVSILADIPITRYNGGCTIINQTIYCYGGTVNQRTSSEHYSLDVSRDFVISKAYNTWRSLSPENFQLEPNSLFSIVGLNDSYIIYGGLGFGTPSIVLKNITTQYFVNNNTWTSIQSGGVTPSRESTATLDSNNRIWVWGGISDNTTIPSLNLTKQYNNTFQVLDMKNQTWLFPDIVVPSFVYPRLEHTATLSSTGNSIFYIGGLFNTATINGKIAAFPMNQIHEFNTIQQEWTLHYTQSDIIPSSRRLHTATLLPEKDLILIYGGALTDASGVVSDYCYTLNTTSFAWTPITIGNSGAYNGPGPLFGHSAVLHNDKSLFLLFGVDKFGYPRNDFFVIDIVNWRYIDHFQTKGDYKLVNSNISISPNEVIDTTDSTESSSSRRCSPIMLFVLSALSILLMCTS
ncbi:hypothetical protein BDB01DRAFT_542227 [Pilobolus umbonatus]|nr:hypothetical protein BDB01DRAFT_542227 [Pilobolus umbonatus]